MTSIIIFQLYSLMREEVRKKRSLRKNITSIGKIHEIQGNQEQNGNSPHPLGNKTNEETGR